MLNIECQFEILDFKMRMLQAEIEMNAMIAENKQREVLGSSMAYGEEQFVELINKHRIHANAIPSYIGVYLDSLEYNSKQK